MAEYNAHYVHRISSKPTPADSEGPFEIRDSAFENRTKLGKAMRDAGILSYGQRLSSYRSEGDKVITFPSKSIWHAIVLEPAENYEPEGVDYPGYTGRSKHRRRA